MIKPSNELILDKSISHSIFLERLKAGETKRIVSMLNSLVLPHIRDEIAKLLVAIKTEKSKKLNKINKKNLKRLEKVFENIKKLTASGYSEIRNTLKQDLLEFSKREVKNQISMISDSIPLNYSFTEPAVPVLRQIVNSSHVLGQPITDIFKSLESRIVNEVKKQVIIGINEGSSIENILSRLVSRTGVFKRERNNIKAVIRTTINHTMTQSRESVYQDNKSLIKKVQYVATLDTRTSIICANLDGRTYEIGVGPRPPRHPNCRSTTIPVLASWKELGIPLKEITNAQRVSMDGKVSQSIRFPEWIKKQDEFDQRKFFGKTRFELFKKGKLTISEMVDQNHRPIDVARLLNSTN